MYNVATKLHFQTFGFSCFSRRVGMPDIPRIILLVFLSGGGLKIIVTQNIDIAYKS